MKIENCYGKEGNVKVRLADDCGHSHVHRYKPRREQGHGGEADTAWSILNNFFIVNELVVIGRGVGIFRNTNVSHA